MNEVSCKVSAQGQGSLCSMESHKDRSLCHSYAPANGRCLGVDFVLVWDQGYRSSGLTCLGRGRRTKELDKLRSVEGRDLGLVLLVVDEGTVDEVLTDAAGLRCSTS